MAKLKTSFPLNRAFKSIFAYILFFPFWWYSLGLVKLLKQLLWLFKDQLRASAFLVWLKNIFVPMYGQNDIGGRLVSFFVRLFQIIVRGALLLVLIALLLIILLIWIILPILLILAILYQFS